VKVKAPTEKNFRRAKVRPGTKKTSRSSGVLRAMSWRMGRWGLAGLVVAYAGYRATTLVLHASGLQIRTIQVRGNVRISSGDVEAMADGLRGSSILTADLESYRKRLKESPWVEDVAIRRVLPSTVEVLVSERRPMGLCRFRDTLYLVDADGTPIDEFGPKYAEFDLPIIDGLMRSPASGQPAIDETRAELAARVMDALVPRKDIADKISQIDVHDAHDAVVMLQDDPALLHLGDEKFLERLQSYVDLAPTLRDQVRNIDSVDLRFGGRVYVRPAKK